MKATLTRTQIETLLSLFHHKKNPNIQSNHYLNAVHALKRKGFVQESYDSDFRSHLEITEHGMRFLKGQSFFIS